MTPYRNALILSYQETVDEARHHRPVRRA
ncbi:hypothetical protein CBM2618_A160126 [Cupriavidus taiwanensis]|nr:hypothetical protein CBM2618_A160126 [Cupriavidus taiwanensis]SPD43413.1 protein of unknown function [Cupriavidus taiwanensis]